MIRIVILYDYFDAAFRANIILIEKYGIMNKALLVLLLGIATLACPGRSQGEAAKTVNPPNILWLTTEDIGPEIGCYGDKSATTPVIDDLASKGVLYSNAFASSCSTS